MNNTTLLAKLRKERNNLAKLERIQRIAEHKRMKAKSEENKIRREISELKRRTSKSFTSRLSRRISNPQTQRRIKMQAKKAKSAFNKFRDFADKYGS